MDRDDLVRRWVLPLVGQSCEQANLLVQILRELPPLPQDQAQRVELLRDSLAHSGELLARLMRELYDVEKKP